MPALVLQRFVSRVQMSARLSVNGVWPCLAPNGCFHGVRVGGRRCSQCFLFVGLVLVFVFMARRVHELWERFFAKGAILLVFRAHTMASLSDDVVWWEVGSCRLFVVVRCVRVQQC